MNEPLKDNNEFGAAEEALRQIGSNLWFGGLSNEWQGFLVANTVQFFDDHHASMLQSAEQVIAAYQAIVRADPSVLQQNPRDTNITLS